MVPTEMPDRAAEKSQPQGAEQAPGGIDFSRYRMNPVQIEESQEAARAIPRRISVYFLILVIVAGAAATIMLWNRRAAQVSPLESLDPGVRERAQEFLDTITMRIPALQGYVYDAGFTSPTQVRIFITPTVLDKSKQERPVSDDEVVRATERVVKEFRGYAPQGKHLTVRAFVVEQPLQAEDQSPVAIGAYDPDTGAIDVKLTTQIPMPDQSDLGGAAPHAHGEGHIGEHGGMGPH